MSHALLAALLFLVLDAGALAANARRSSDLAYRVKLVGVSEEKLRTFLKENSKLLTQIKTPPMSRMALEQRTREDKAQLSEVLKSEGYYAALVESRIDFRTKPIGITLDIATGPRFLLGRFEIVYVNGSEGLEPEAREAAEASALKAGAPARAADILAAQERVVESLRRSGYPFVAIREAHYSISLDDKTMTVRLDVAPGGSWRFGEIVLEGLRDVEPGYVLRKAPWTRGARFDVSKLAAYRQTLDATGLFQSVHIEPAPERAGGEGELPVRVSLVERKPRTIGIGVQYSTNEGPGGRIFWEHRNFMHRARTLDLSVSGNPTRQAFEGSYRQPEFLRSDQALFARLALSHESSDAFNALSLVSAIGLERQLKPALSISAAVEFERARIEDQTGLSKVSLVSLPLVGNYDTSNDFLDPSRGLRWRLKVAPSVGDNHGGVSFLTVESSASGYIPVIAKPKTILALRARLGAIAGANVDDVPADHRFYAGGGGSLRAYGYRDAGPLDAQGDPTGGRAVTEIGAELRIRAGKQFGVVPFFEGGNVYEKSLPGFDRFLWGAGLGLRYFSAVGPLRLDIAVPLNRRRGVDAQVQVYVSIGQAF
jgi:translocation and assembly module TamA